MYEHNSQLDLVVPKAGTFKQERDENWVTSHFGDWGLEKNDSRKIAQGDVKTVIIGDSYIEFPGSSATVTLAAEQLGCEPDRIAKSLAIKLKSGRLLVIVVSGESKLDNSKFKKLFKETSHFCPAELLPELFGHPMGGVCPFALKDNVEIFLDESLKKYDIVYPAAGAPNNAVKITPERLAEILSAGWVAVTK